MWDKRALRANVEITLRLSQENSRDDLNAIFFGGANFTNIKFEHRNRSVFNIEIELNSTSMVFNKIRDLISSTFCSMELKVVA